MTFTPEQVAKYMALAIKNTHDVCVESTAEEMIEGQKNFSIKETYEDLLKAFTAGDNLMLNQLEEEYKTLTK